MFKLDDMRNLIALLDNKSDLMSAINKLSEEDAKVALYMSLISWHKSTEIIDEQADFINKNIGGFSKTDSGQNE